jgi:hypothetical protein
MLNIPPRVYPLLQSILIKQQSRTPLFEMAMGYVIAHHAPLPPVQTPNAIDVYIGASAGNPLVSQFLGTLSDFMPIQAFAIKAHAEAFWMAKYDLVHGKAVPIQATDNGLMNITRMGVYFTPENCDVMANNAIELNNLICLGDAIYDFLRDNQQRSMAVNAAPVATA